MTPLEWFKKNYTLTPLEENGKYLLRINDYGPNFETSLIIKLPQGYVIDVEDGKINKTIDNSSFGGPVEWARQLNDSEIKIIFKKEEARCFKKELTAIIIEAYDPFYAWKT